MKDLNALSILMNFPWIYLGEKGGCTNACICMGTHSQPLLQSRLMDVYETWWGWSARGTLQVLLFSARSVQGRIQGGAKIGHGGSPSSTNFFFRPEGYSNKPNA